MRKPRLLREGVIYYIFSEINRWDMDLAPADIKALLLLFIKKAQQKYPFELLNFCIMDNQIHLVIKPAEGQSLSKIMQWIKGNFARHWNKLHHTSGHLWGERFVSKIIEDVEELFRTFKDIDECPVKAQLVAKAGDWAFCGLYHDVRGRLDVVAIPRSAMSELFFGIGG